MRQHSKCIFGIGESMGAAVLLQSVEKERRFCAVVAESFGHAAHGETTMKNTVVNALRAASSAP
jgi:hypothetical protein